MYPIGPEAYRTAGRPPAFTSGLPLPEEALPPYSGCGKNLLVSR